jgi:2-keto-4-pentenoate hydratase
MQTNELQDVAATLRAARANGEPVTAPTKTWPALDADAAFEVQRINVGEAVANGDRIVGYKLGNIAKVMQDAFGLDQPDYGYLLASTFAYEGTTLARERFIEPFVELEPAFVLRDSLRGPNVTVADVITAIDYRDPRSRNHRLPSRELGDRPSRHFGRQWIHRGGHSWRNPQADHRSHSARHPRCPALQRA